MWRNSDASSKNSEMMSARGADDERRDLGVGVLQVDEVAERQAA